MALAVLDAGQEVVGLGAGQRAPNTVPMTADTVARMRIPVSTLAQTEKRLVPPVQEAGGEDQPDQPVRADDVTERHRLAWVAPITIIHRWRRRSTLRTACGSAPRSRERWYIWTIPYPNFERTSGTPLEVPTAVMITKWMSRCPASCRRWLMEELLVESWGPRGVGQRDEQQHEAAGQVGGQGPAVRAQGGRRGRQGRRRPTLPGEGDRLTTPCLDRQHLIRSGNRWRNTRARS